MKQRVADEERGGVLRLSSPFCWALPIRPRVRCWRWKRTVFGSAPGLWWLGEGNGVRKRWRATALQTALRLQVRLLSVKEHRSMSVRSSSLPQSFPPTQWRLILWAGDEDSISRSRALERICHTHWRLHAESRG